MRERLFALLSVFLLTTPSLAARADVSVQFVEPSAYTDASPNGYGSDDLALRTLATHLQNIAGRCLPAGDKLEVRVLNVDLAGQREWWHGSAYDIRVMREITWPSISLDYVWHDATGKVMGEARSERVADMNYLSHSAFVRNSGDALPYEKWMLREWAERRFCRGAT